MLRCQAIIKETVLVLMVFDIHNLSHLPDSFSFLRHFNSISSLLNTPDTDVITFRSGLDFDLLLSALTHLFVVVS